VEIFIENEQARRCLWKTTRLWLSSALEMDLNWFPFGFYKAELNERHEWTQKAYIYFSWAPVPLITAVHLQVSVETQSRNVPRYIPGNRATRCCMKYNRNPCSMSKITKKCWQNSGRVQISRGKRKGKKYRS